jgi:hypothetical protein
MASAASLNNFFCSRGGIIRPEAAKLTMLEYRGIDPLIPPVSASMGIVGV